MSCYWNCKKDIRSMYGEVLELVVKAAKQIIGKFELHKNKYKNMV
ncbi:hypothetical protein BD780_000080 [Clostridium tetanomorphum]|nr:hypothetical protein [Clostridium tetanomorphum]MBP1863026.1 hypothetical protein [Clostridium tetanomorphum]NRS82855.1 hypothetical protein [Clostridium tetanomorphum]